MANWLELITQVFKDSLGQPDDEPKLPTVLRNLDARIQDLLQFSAGLDGNGIDQWLAKLHALIDNNEIRDSLLVRALQLRLPPLAEMLTFLGIIEFDFEPDLSRVRTFRLNWQRLNRLSTAPGDYAADIAPGGGLGLLLSKIQKIKDAKAMQVLGLLLLASPDELLKLDYRKEGFTGLPLAGAPGITLQELIDLINSPLRLPLPFTPPLSLANIKAQAGPAADGPAGHIALLGPDGAAEDAVNSLDGLGVELRLKDASAAAAKTLDLGRGWGIHFSATGSGQTTFRITISGNKLNTNPNPDAHGDFGVYLARQVAAGENAVLIGAADGTHLAIKSALFGLRFHEAAPLYDLVTRLEQIEFALKPDFLKFFQFGLDLPSALKFDSDVEASYVQGHGLSAQGSAGGLPALGVQFAQPLNLKIGSNSAGLNVEQILVRLEAKFEGSGFRFRVLMRYGATARIGPLSAVMDGAGAWLGRWDGGTAGLLPPQGIGLSLLAGPVDGGGFLRIISDSEFAGALQLKILGIGAFAYGLYKTLPSGEPSFVALIGIRLPPPGIQVSFGFAISGFGGLVGINRRANTDLLRERLASGAAGDVLFNDNPMQNAPRLLGDMQQFFPDEKGIFLIGPTLQINWLYLLRLDVGVFIELPGPRKIFIAGSARMVIGSEDVALIYLRMDFVGGIDLTKRLIFFDAALVNSSVLGIFRITGGIALRIAYGDNGYFLFSVGGFHPSFNPGALELPKLARAGSSVSISIAWLKMEMYLALTSNTFQLGSRTEAGLDIGPISAHGWFGFDALIQFEPFYFVGRVDAGFDVEVEGVSFCGVRVDGQLSGPGPLVLQGRASVHLLFVKVSASATITLNDNPPAIPPPIINLLESLRPELKAPENLRAEGEDASVIFAPTLEAPTKLVAPVGKLIWEQKRVPLNLPIQKLVGIELGGWHTLHVTSGLPEESADDWFGVGTYLKLSDSEALNNARFARQAAGVRVGAGPIIPGVFQQNAKIQIKLMKIPHPPAWLPLFALSSQYMNAGLIAVLAERAGGAKAVGGAPGVVVQAEQWNAHAADGTIKMAALNSAQAFAQTKLSGGIALPAVEKAVNLTGVI